MPEPQLHPNQAELEAWFLKHDPRSFSPETSVMLLECARSVDRILKEGADKEPGAQDIIAYRDALYLVSKVSHIQQGVVIEKFAVLVGLSKAGQKLAENAEAQKGE